MNCDASRGVVFVKTLVELKRRRVAEAAQRSAAYALLFAFTRLLLRKLNHVFSGSWWDVFTLVWLFHALVAQGRFSIPAPLDIYSCQWPPFHAVVATPLLVAFELLLCIHLDNSSAVNLKIVFFPLVLLEIIIIIDNFKMYFTLMREEAKDSSTVDDTWGKITHCLIILSMAFYLGATLFMVLMLTGYTSRVNWWGPSLVFSVGHCFAFSVCKKWTSPIIDIYPQIRVCSSSSRPVDYLNQASCLDAEVENHQKPTRMCSLHAIGGHFMMVMIIVFHVLLCMYLQGTHVRAREIPLGVIFSPLLLLLGVGAVFSTLQLIERIVMLLLNIESVNVRYFMFSSRAYDFLEFMLHGSSFLGWWSFVEGSRKPNKQLLYDGESRYYNFSDNPPDVLMKMSRRDLHEEVWMLQIGLNEEIKTTESRNPKQLQKVVCRICSEKEIDVVLFPCTHWIICRSCSNKCSECPTCGVSIDEALLVYDS